jgi:hypothetical protein
MDKDEEKGGGRRGDKEGLDGKWVLNSLSIWGT